MTDTNEHAHLLQQHQELSRQIAVAEDAKKAAAQPKGVGPNQILDNQIKSYQEELARVEAQMQAAGMDMDHAKAQRELQVHQALEQANVPSVSDPEENKRQEEAQRENMQNRNKQETQSASSSQRGKRE